MGNKKDKKERINVVYSTNPNYQYEYNQEEEQETLAPEKQNLQVSLDSKQRKGKTVTLVQGFVGSEEDLKELAKLLKNKCGVRRLREGRGNYHPRRTERKSINHSSG